MSADAAVVARMMAMLEDDAALRRAVHGVYDRPTPRASMPFVVIGAVGSGDWGTKDRIGSEVRVELRHVTATGPDEGLVAASIQALASGLRGIADSGSGRWEIVSARLLRTRIAYDRQGQWSQSFDIRVRCLKVL